MTKSEAIDAINQAGPLIESLERILRKAMAVLDISDDALPKEKVEPPKLRVVRDEHTSDYGKPVDWTWDTLPKWDDKIYGDD